METFDLDITRDKPKRSSFVRWIIIIVAMAFVGILLLAFVGRYFLREVAQDVTIEKYEATVGAKVGERAPYFELPDLDGKIVKISDFLDMPLVLVFWSTWNTAATDQLRILDEFLAENKFQQGSDPCDTGIGSLCIIAIASQEDRSTVQNFISRGGYKISVVLDETGAVGEAYGIRNLPLTLFVNKDGIIQDAVMGVMGGNEILNRAENIIK